MLGERVHAQGVCLDLGVGTLGFGSNALIHVALPPLSSFIFLGNAFSDAHGSHIAPVPLPALPPM